MHCNAIQCMTSFHPNLRLWLGQNFPGSGAASAHPAHPVLDSRTQGTWILVGLSKKTKTKRQCRTRNPGQYESHSSLQLIPFQAWRLRCIPARDGELAEDQEGHRHRAGARRGQGVPQWGEGSDQAGFFIDFFMNFY